MSAPVTRRTPSDECCASRDLAGRRAFLASALGAVAAACAGPSADGSARRQADLLRHGAAAVEWSLVVDCHAHPGCFTRGMHLPSSALDDMQRGGVNAALFSVVTDGPVLIVSHTAPAALRLHRRHVSDDLIRAVATSGGIIGIWPYARPGIGIEQLVGEVRYVGRLVGMDHVGIGTDLAGLRGLTSIVAYADFAAVPAALLAGGLSETDVRKVLGGNLMRVFEAVSG